MEQEVYNEEIVMDVPEKSGMFYSPSSNHFLSLYDKKDFGDRWPSDAVELDEAQHKEFCLDMPKEGYIRVPSPEGYPMWQKVSDDVLLQSRKAEMDAVKQSLISDASQKINILQSIVDAGIQTDEDVANLKEWALYRIKVYRVNTETTEDILWPKAPM